MNAQEHTASAADGPRPEATPGTGTTDVVATQQPHQPRESRGATERDRRMADVWQLATCLWPALHALGYRSGVLGGRGGKVDILSGLPPHLRHRDGQGALDPAQSKAFMSFVAPIPARFPHTELAIKHQDRDLVEVRGQRGRLDVVLQGVPFKQWTCPLGADRVFAEHATDFVRRGVALTRRGGSSIHLVHQMFLDAPDPDLRRQVARHADMVGALRLPFRPTTAHSEEPAPPLDVVLLRRRPRGAGRTGHPFTVPVGIVVDGKAATINEYYARHPGNVLGTLVHGNKGHPTMLAPTIDREGLGWQIHRALGRIAAVATQRGLTAADVVRPPERPNHRATGFGL
ncbi:hypothetical protein [Myceligenerans xiligouense]|uniref:Uncharacterized protein n=1 Tax=Myceligenerans xiligouense TaxID=253184 RepID=A0A3N4YPP9_9MICO|nr:hypothetical protein [Myceligenerans xiligouense]RPF21446.1 hypothetical protein EDD34_2074 [Myceligenerans xiligouense]